MQPENVTKTTKSVRVGPRGVVYAVRREFENKKNPSRKFYMRRTHRFAARIVQETFSAAVELVSNNIKK